MPRPATVIPYTLEVGEGKLPLAPEYKVVTGVAFVDLRGRQWPLRWLSRKEFEEVRLGRPEFRGQPQYYCLDREHESVDVWPCAAHQWQMVVLVDTRANAKPLHEEVSSGAGQPA